MSNGYKCSLNSKILKTAQDELNEDPKQRLGAVETFREWILSQKHIRSPTDTLFLLKFLRAAKFSQLVARQWLTNYLTLTTKRPELFANIDLGDEKVQHFYRTGYCLLPERRDPEGRQIFIVRPGVLDPTFKHYDKETMYKAMLGCHLYLLTQEDIQVTGFIFLMDATGFTMSQSRVWNLDDMKLNDSLLNKCYPGRINSFNYYNVNPIFEALFELARACVSKKMRNRIKGHGSNMESVYKVVPKECLPVEYLPDDYDGPHCGTIQELANSLADKVAQPKVRDRILRDTSPEYFHIDFSQSQDIKIPQESFRKLCVD